MVGMEKSIRPQLDHFVWPLLALTLLLLSLFWFRGGVTPLYFDTDMGRDLSELSNIWLHHIVWIGPRLGPGLQASPSYYYFFFPFLLLGGGNANALIIGNVLFALVSLAIFGYLSVRKWGWAALFGVGVLGILPWWTENILRFGNGYTFAFWELLGITFLWFDFPFLLSALCLGTAISFHPAAIFVLPILGSEWWRRKHQLKQLPLIAFGLLLPWAPIIWFEFITKGYLTRQWLAHPSAGMYWQLTLANWHQMSNALGVGLWVATLGVATIILMAKRRMKVWVGATAAASVFFLFVDSLPLRYVLGVLVLWSFLAVITFVQHKWGRVLLASWFVLLLINNVIFAKPLLPASRSITSVQNVANQFVAQTPLDQSKKIAVVAVLTPQVEVPQADDYRFFLRLKGLKVLEVQQYSQADLLIEFIEVPNFSWQTWSSWETDQISNRHLVSDQQINGTEVVVYSK